MLLTCFRCCQIGNVSKYCPVYLKSIGNKYENCRKKSLEQKQSKIALFNVSATNKRKTLIVEVQINGYNTFCIIDTGASISLISRDQWQIMNVINTSLLPSDIAAEAANNSTIRILHYLRSLKKSCWALLSRLKVLH